MLSNQSLALVVGRYSTFSQSLIITSLYRYQLLLQFLKTRFLPMPVALAKMVRPEVLEGVADRVLTTFSLPQHWRRDPIAREVMAELNVRPGSWMYRAIEDKHLRRGCMLAGNPQSVCSVFDRYTPRDPGDTSRGPRLRFATSLGSPGLNVMGGVPSSYFYGEPGTSLVRFKLAHALDLGAKLYQDATSHAINAAYVTVPFGASVKVQVLPPSCVDTLSSLERLENQLGARQRTLAEARAGRSPIIPGSERYLEVVQECDAFDREAAPLRLKVDQIAKAETARRMRSI
jgi:hypothetical protein